ncbi:TetR/AcrR family transcriptional regulator [Aeromicrobium sp. P5_D10]
MVERAQLSQERSRVRREALLQAAIELFAEGGSRAITHRAVAARAGLPSATTTYYFESIDELIRASLSAHLVAWTTELEAFTQVDFEIDVSLDAAVDLIGTVFAARGPEVAALELSIFLAAAREPSLHDLTSRALQALESLAVSLLSRVGVAEAPMLAASIVALIAGTALRRQSTLYDETDEARILTTAIRQLVAAHAIGPDGVDEALAALRSAD